MIDNTALREAHRTAPTQGHRDVIEARMNWVWRAHPKLYRLRQLRGSWVRCWQGSAA